MMRIGADFLRVCWRQVSVNLQIPGVRPHPANVGRRIRMIPLFSQENIKVQTTVSSELGIWESQKLYFVLAKRGLTSDGLSHLPLSVQLLSAKK